MKRRSGIQKISFLRNAIFEVYPITQKNYREVIKARSLTEYKTFFEANY